MKNFTKKIKNKNILLVITTIAIATIGAYIIHTNVRQNGALMPVSNVSAMYANITCRDSALAQLEAYNTDPLATTTTFDKYRVPLYSGPLAMLNTKTSSKQVINFKTMIDDQLKSTDINFAGKYSLVYVGMTGWGANYFLVDRTNGKGIIFPYLINALDTQKNSSLLMINPKSIVFAQTDDPEDQFCGPTISNIQVEQHGVDLRPHYYVWNGTTFQNLGVSAPVNQFWKQE